MDDRGLAFGINRIIKTADGYDGLIIAMSQAQNRHLMDGYLTFPAIFSELSANPRPSLAT